MQVCYFHGRVIGMLIRVGSELACVGVGIKKLIVSRQSTLLTLNLIP